MKFAYADPPYIGQAKRHYKNDPSGIEAQEVDHEALINMLEIQYPDGWALSLSSPSLRCILPICPSRARVMAWVKPFCSFKPGVPIAYAWEPIIVCGGRPRTRNQDTCRDWVSANITLQKGTHGAKPTRFCWQLFNWLNIEEGDELADLYPGSGAVSNELAYWLTTSRMPL